MGENRCHALLQILARFPTWLWFVPSLAAISPLLLELALARTLDI